MGKVELRIRPWPWSVSKNSHLWTEGSPLRFQYYGSPVIEVASDVKLFLPARHESFTRLSYGYKTAGGSELLLYEAPHGVLSGPGGKTNDPKILMRGRDKTCMVRIEPDGAAPRQATPQNDSELVTSVLSWSQFFDDCYGYGAGEVQPWNNLAWFKDYQSEADEPRMALIVHIAEEMEKRIEHIVRQARKVLVRERVLLPAGRIDETDTACLQWYIRQPGTTSAQKAAANRQTLLGVARKETYNTLENRVLKAFIALCSKEARRYINREAHSKAQIRTSRRGKTVLRLQVLCADLIHHPVLESVAELHGRVQPNYVLQNDPRYREVWRNYIRLLHKEDEEDCLWDWQTRTWSDVVRLLCHAALCTSGNIQPLRHSQVAFRKEQLLGSRVVEHTGPGPFLVQMPSKREWVLEVVHPDQMHLHSLTNHLTRLAGHLYLVLRKINSNEERVIVIWAVHAIASTRNIDWEAVSKDAKDALQRHMDIISDSYEVPVKALVAASVTDRTEVDIEITSGGVPVLLLPSDPVYWKAQLENFGALLITQIEEAVQ